MFNNLSGELASVGLGLNREVSSFLDVSILC